MMKDDIQKVRSGGDTVDGEKVKHFVRRQASRSERRL